MADKLDGAAIVANSLPATAIVAGSITTTQLAPSVANVVTVGSNPKIASLTYPDDDTAANTGGGQTVVINGSGFKSNVSVYINGNAVPSVTYTNANSISITTPALAAATYPLYVINTDDGGTAILIPGIQYSGTPSWVTESSLDQQQALSAWSISLSATSDSSVTYSLQAGSSLPSGISLAANGLISGTMSSPPESDTTYNFTVVATDAEFQDASKAFSVSVTVVVDTQFQYTTLLLQADGTNNGNNHAFLDSSDNNFTITRNGNATQGSFSPFSPTGWSNYFPSNAYITAASNTGFAIGTTGTVEGWWYFTVDADLSGTNNKRLYCVTNNTSSLDAYIASRNIYLHGNAVSTVGTNLQPNQWYHIAIVYNSGAVSIYVNGISQTLTGTTTGYNISSTGTLVINEFLSAGYQLSGYTSNFRIVKGTAVYTSNFTPSTAPLAAIANTVLLTCQSNRFRDTQGITITSVNSPSVQTFSPFATTTAYSPATHGGAAYFDGTGDYLTTTGTSSFNGSTGNWTFECWCYLLSAASNDIIVVGRASSSDVFYFQWVGTTLYLGDGVSNTIGASNAKPINQWFHAAVVKNGSTYTAYINGTSVGSSTTALQNANVTSFEIGARSSQNWFLNGYMSGFRFTQSAVYTSAFTPPTSPPSNIANTALLLNFTNAQIYDAAAGIVLETVGDAKVNTAIKKFGAGSMVFDGNGDVLTAPPSVNYINGTGDWTYEFWVYYNALPTGGTYGASIYAQDDGAGVVSPFNIVQQGNTWKLWASSDGSTWGIFNEVTLATTSLATSTWYHIAFVRASGTLRMFVNGTQVASTALTASIHTNTSRKLWLFGTWQNNPSNAGGINGYIDDVRLTKGLARYRYNFTPPTRAFPTKGGSQTLTADEYFDYTTLLLPGNGTNNQNNHTFLDSSDNNFTITRNGNATQGTFSPFSQTGWSAYFDGTGDYLTTNATQAIPATGDFTIEAWVYPTASGPGRTIVSQGTTGSSGRLQLNVHTDNTLQFGITSSLVYSTGKVAPNFWNHIAVTRTGSSVTFYINGANAGTATLSGTVQNTALWIGAEWSGDPYRWLGYISNVRISNVVRTITSAPTAAFTSDANTVLLACQSNRFIDNSSNAYTITRAGDVSVQAFSPFAPTASYAAANVGGSGYFDGTGDYLSIADNVALDMGSSDFTIEGWYYPLGSASSSTALFSKRANSGTVGGVLLYYGGSGLTPSLLVDIGGSWAINTSSAVPFIANQWNHFAVVRNGSAFNLYINGVSGVSATNAGTIPDNSAAFAIGAMGADGSGPISPCYMSGFRVVKGTAVYTGAFTPPAAPLTNIANTSLLTNFTNAGITDATAKTVFETIGDAKISTAQSKFGGSSIAFDGTGDRLYRDVRNERYFNLGNGGSDFTFECWVYFNSLSGCVGARGGGFAGWNSTSGHQINLGSFSGGSFYIQWWNGSTIVSNQLTNPFATGRWYHYAITLSSGTLRWFIDGIQRFSTSATIVTPSQAYYFTLGDLPSVDGAMNGYMDDVRITEGIARYTQNFALPTTAFLTK